MAKENNRYFDDFLNEDFNSHNDEYRKEYEKEKFKLDLAVQIRNLREEQGLTQREFADKVRVAQSTIANIEKSNSVPSRQTIYQIAEKNNKKLKITISRII